MGALFIANLKMLVRNRQAIFWALVFPLVFVVIFGLFDLEGPGTVDMALVVQGEDRVTRAIVDQLAALSFLRLDSSFGDVAAARRALEAGRVDAVLVLPPQAEAQLREAAGRQGPEVGNPHGPLRLLLLQDEANAARNQIVRSALEQTVQRLNLELAGAPMLVTLEQEGLRTRRVGYFDFLLPGIIGMGVMNYAVIGMGSAVSLYREQKIFKRLLVTPLRVRSFFMAQIGAYLVLSLVQVLVILAAGVLLFGARVYGNVLWALPLVLFGNLVFLNLGFFVGALAKTVAAASGLGNIITLPMMFFSGAFFPTEALPAVLREAVRLLPLTPLLEALRGVMLDGQALWAYPGQLALLAVWVVASGVLAVRTFRFG